MKLKGKMKKSMTRSVIEVHLNALMTTRDEKTSGSVHHVIEVNLRHKTDGQIQSLINIVQVIAVHTLEEDQTTPRVDQDILVHVFTQIGDGQGTRKKTVQMSQSSVKYVLIMDRRRLRMETVKYKASESDIAHFA